jgi:hypothetical protein
MIAFGAALAGTSAAGGAVPGDVRLAAQADRAAGCAIRRDRAASRELALAEPGSEREVRAHAAAAPTIRRCFEAQKLVDTPETRTLFAGAVARLLYVGSGRFSVRRNSRAAPTTTQLKAMVDAWNSQRAISAPKPGPLQCAIGRDSEAADALVRSVLAPTASAGSCRR